MYITNYNGISHDIYLFTGGMTLCATPPTLDEAIPGIRVQASPSAYNTSGLWYSNTIGHTADFSGLSVRNRGSSLSSRWNTYKDGASVVNSATAPYNNDVLNFLNWNNELSPFVIISDTHFIGCKHFIGEDNIQNQQTPLFLGKNNTHYNISGTYIGTYSDVVLYEMNTPLDNTQKAQLAIYEWLDIAGINDYYKNDIVLWRQSNQGFFVAYKPNKGTIDFPISPSPLGNGFPEWDGKIWSGDSGTPVLATYKGKTYLAGIADGTFAGFAYNSSCSLGSYHYDNLTETNIEVNISNSLHTQVSSGWYLYKDENGYEQFILAPTIRGVIDIIYDNITQRTVKGSSDDWKTLKDFNTQTLDQLGAHRIQKYFDMQTTPTVRVEGDCT